MVASDSLLSEDQAALRLGVKSQTLALWRMTGRYDLPFIRVGRLVRYRVADLDRWLDSRTVRTGKGELVTE
jgi:excisionase family DNA binding protein